MSTLKGKTLFITGASRGIGKAVGLRAAQDGANVVVAAKTAEPHPKLDGTIYTAAAEMDAAGGKGLAVVCDIRDEDQVTAAVEKAVDTFGGIDICVNNASAIFIAGTLNTPMKRFDLMHQINSRGTFMVSQKCLPHLLKAENPHILNMAPPLSYKPDWYGRHLAYTMAKMGMSMCVVGMSEEFKEQGVAVNGLWPVATVATAAIQNLLGGDEMMRRSRMPAVMADSAHIILTRNSRECTGTVYTDERVFAEEGITDLSKYAVDPTVELEKDIFVDKVWLGPEQ